MMSKIFVDTDQVNTNIINQCRQAISYLENALDNINQCNVPNQYSSVNSFYNIKSDIVNLKMKLNNIVEWASISARNIENCNRSICNQLQQLDISYVNKQQIVVNNVGK